MKKLVVVLVLTAFATGLFAAYLLMNRPEPVVSYSENSRFGFLSLPILEQSGYEESILADLSVPWFRLLGGPFVWNIVEPTEGGGYDFSMTDARIRNAQNKGIQVLPVIWPFAGWDQKYWEQHSGRCETEGEFSEFGIPKSRCKPYNIEAYKQFVRAVVERYDGDGNNDMSGLRYPVKYWEAANEPSHDAYFVGSVGDYLDVLQVTYEAVKSADPDAEVLVGAPAPVQQSEFWSELLRLGGGEYFDIANIHQSPAALESSTVFINEILENYGFKKPIWVTESGDPVTEDEGIQAVNLVKGYVAAFANGVERVFYNLYETFPMIEGREDLANMALIEDGRRKPSYYAMWTMVGKLDPFTSVEKLVDGQYKFIIENKPVYVLWGTGSVPSEIIGTITVTDISGATQLKQASEITLNDSPIFVELI